MGLFYYDVLRGEQTVSYPSYMTDNSYPQGHMRLYFDIYALNNMFQVNVNLNWYFTDNPNSSTDDGYINTLSYGWIWRVEVSNLYGDTEVAEFKWRPTKNGSYGRINYYDDESIYNNYATLYIDRGPVTTSEPENLRYKVSVLPNPKIAQCSFVHSLSGILMSLPSGYMGVYTYKTLDVTSPTSSSITTIRPYDTFTVKTNRKMTSINEYTCLISKMNGYSRILDSGYEQGGNNTYTLQGSLYHLSAGKEYKLSLQHINNTYSQFDSPIVYRTYRTYSTPNVNFKLNSWYNADEVIKFKVNEWRGNFGTENSNCVIYSYNGKYYNTIKELSNNIYEYNSSVLNMSNSVKTMLERFDGQDNKSCFKIDRRSVLDTASTSVNTKLYFKPTNTPSFSYGYFKYTNGTVSNKSLSTTVSTKGTSINCINIPVTYNGRGFVNGYQVFVRQNNNSSIVNNFYVNATNNRSKNFETNIRINANILTSTRQYSIDVRPYYVYMNGSKGYGSNYTINNAIHYLTPSNAGIGCNTFTSSGVWVGKNMILYFQLPKDANYFSLVDTERSNYRYQDVIVNIVTYNNNNSYTYKYSTHKQYFDCNDELTYGKYLNFNIGLTDIPKNVMIKQCNISVVYSSKTDGMTHKFKIINMRDSSDVLYNGVYNSRIFTYDGTVTLLEKFVNYTEGTIIKDTDIRHLFHILYGMIMYVREVLIYQPYYDTYTSYYYDGSYSNISGTHIKYKNHYYYGSTLETIIDSLKNILSYKYQNVITTSDVSYGTMLLYLLGYTYERTVNAQNKNFSVNYMSDYFEYYNNRFSYPSVLDKNIVRGNIITLEEYKIIAQCLLNIVKGIEIVL